MEATLIFRIVVFAAAAILAAAGLGIVFVATQGERTIGRVAQRVIGVGLPLSLWSAAVFITVDFDVAWWLVASVWLVYGVCGVIYATFMLRWLYQHAEDIQREQARKQAIDNLVALAPRLVAVVERLEVEAGLTDEGETTGEL